MKKAWVENGIVRDVCADDPIRVYHPDVAVHYSTNVPDECQDGWLVVDGEFWPPIVLPTPEYVAPVIVSVVPAQISMKQARLALLRADLYKAAQDALANMAGTAGQEARILWEYSAAVDRQSPLVIGVSAALGMDSEKIDQLFILAATL